MREDVLTFGPGGHLVGTACTPSPDQPRSGIGFILMNAGVTPRMGPHRFNVKLARRLAAHGHASLRLDLSGQGDSLASPGADSYEQQTMSDLRAAVDTLISQAGVHSVVVGGICSGAYAAYHYGQQDERVIGLWMFDGFTYPTAKTSLMRALKQLRHQPKLTLHTWLDKIRQRIAAGSTAAPPPEDSSHDDDTSFGPSQDTYAAAMQALSDRGVSLFVMFSSDVLWRYSYAGQFHDAFRDHAFVKRVRCDHLPDIDHTITTLGWQTRVMSAIEDWSQQLAR